MQPCRYEFPYFFPMHDCHALGLIGIAIHQPKWVVEASCSLSTLNLASPSLARPFIRSRRNLQMRDAKWGGGIRLC